MGTTTEYAIDLPLRGDGTALENVATALFGVIDVKVEKGTVMYVPDPDNEEHTIFWVRGAGPDGVGVLAQPGETVRVTLVTGEM